MMEWLSFAASGLALVTAGPTLHSYISGFTLSRKVDEVLSEVQLISGEVVKVTGGINKVAPHHYMTNTLGVSVAGDNTVNFAQSSKLARPHNIGMDYVTECETEVENSFSRAFLESPENFLHGISDLNETGPDQALLRDNTLVPWHFNQGGNHKIGFTKRGFLDHLGISYVPLKEHLRPRAIPPTKDADNIELFGQEIGDSVREESPSGKPEQIEFLEDPPHAKQDVVKLLGRARTFARIKSYRGQKTFTGIHEYFVACPHCGVESDFPTGFYVRRFLKMRCPKCGEPFTAEVVRTNLSLRFHKDWTGGKE